MDQQVSLAIAAGLRLILLCPSSDARSTPFHSHCWATADTSSSSEVSGFGIAMALNPQRGDG
jgi:hypothetical protein